MRRWLSSSNRADLVYLLEDSFLAFHERGSHVARVFDGANLDLSPPH